MGANVTGELKLRQAALIAGLAYLSNPITFSEMYALPKLVVDSASQTVANLTAYPHLFAAAILANVFSLIGDVVIAWALYRLLAPVHRELSLLAAWLQVTYAAITVAAAANLGVIYRVLVLPSYISGVDRASLPTQVTLLLANYRSGWGMGLIFFGLHLVVLGALMARSRYMPRWLGWLLVVDGVAWVVNSVSVYTFPHANLGWLNLFFTPELIFTVWLLGWGARLKEPVPDQTGV